MHLEGSCHCGSVKLCAESNEFLPFMRCYCSIWRKTTGAGGYAINIGADNRTMKITGRQHLRVYRAPLDNETRPDPFTDCTSCATPAARGDRAWQRGDCADVQQSAGAAVNHARPARKPAGEPL